MGTSESNSRECGVSSVRKPTIASAGMMYNNVIITRNTQNSDPCTDLQQRIFSGYNFYKKLALENFEDIRIFIVSTDQVNC